MRLRDMRGHEMRTVALALALAVAAGCAGWGLDGGAPAKHFTVDISNLDWVEISYIPRLGDPIWRSPCRLSLMGSGEIEIRAGRSPQVWDAFSDKVDDPHWDNFYTDRQHIGQEGMQGLYQEFVDGGLFPLWAPSSGAVPTRPFVKINAHIGRERSIRVTSDAATLQVVERVLAQFEGTGRLAGAEDTK